MRTRDMVLTMFLSVIGGAVLFGILGWFGAKLNPEFVLVGIPTEPYSGVLQVENFMVGHAAYRGVAFGFLTGVLTVIVKAFGRKPD